MRSDVTNLIEVVFENVIRSYIMKLLNMLILSTQKINDIQCSENINLFTDGQLSKKQLDRFLDFGGDATVLINMQAMNVGDIVLPTVQLRLVKYGNQYDIDFNFDSNELVNIDTMLLIKEVHSFSKNLAYKHSITSFFCGMEPASDEDTRYFTNEELGSCINKT